MSDGSRPSPSGGERRTGWAQLESGEAVELATPLRRLGARLLDGIVIAAIFLFLAFVVLGAAVASDDSMTLGIGVVGFVVLSTVVSLGYEVALRVFWGWGCWVRWFEVR